MKVIQLQGLTFRKPRRLLQAKSCIQVHAESPGEINGKCAAASLGGPRLPWLPSVLPTCLLSTLKTVVLASEKSRRPVSVILAGSFRSKAEYSCMWAID